MLDPGHGGTKKTGGSSHNNATSASGVLEKAMTLDLAKAVQSELRAIADATPGSKIRVHLTRTGDSNLGLAARAGMAAGKGGRRLREHSLQRLQRQRQRHRDLDFSPPPTAT